MRWILLADIHGSREALDAVLEDARCWPDARLVVAGDVVGYGPDPQVCIDILREREALVVQGNHDAAVVGLTLTGPMSPRAQLGILWTRSVLPPHGRAWLAALPRTIRLGRFLVCHGDGEDYERYIDSPRRAVDALARLARDGVDRVVHGHTHDRGVYTASGAFADAPDALPAKTACLVNPGSVGQAMGEIPLACYARYDDTSDELELRAIEYDYGAVLEKQRRAGLVPIVTRPFRRGGWRGALTRAFRRALA